MVGWRSLCLGSRNGMDLFIEQKIKPASTNYQGRDNEHDNISCRIYIPNPFGLDDIILTGIPDYERSRVHQLQAKDKDRCNEQHCCQQLFSVQRRNARRHQVTYQMCVQTQSLFSQIPNFLPYFRNDPGKPGQFSVCTLRSVHPKTTIRRQEGPCSPKDIYSLRKRRLISSDGSSHKADNSHSVPS